MRILFLQFLMIFVSFSLNSHAKTTIGILSSLTQETTTGDPTSLISDAIKSKETVKTVCLNMIVKNESKVIRRCLESVKNQIDYWVIVDTGSTDGTQEIIKEFMKEIPGELHERPWVNFGHNRQEALNLAKNKADYLLLMDADETLVYSSDCKNLPLELDYYYVPVQGSKAEFVAYNRFLLINTHFDWEWKDILHEYLEIPLNAKTFEALKNITCFTDSDGSRADDPKKYYKDAAVFEKALETDPDNARYVFYLAQSYCNAKEYGLAQKYYEKRATMSGGWDAEIFWSLFTSACIQEAEDKPQNTIINAYYKAYLSDPSRAEPLYRLAKYFNSLGHGISGYALSKLALSFKIPKDSMYTQDWVYDYGILCTLYDSARLLNKKEEACSILEMLLTKDSLPEDIRNKTQKALTLLKTICKN